MLPTITKILADLEADKISRGQAQAWIDQHLSLAREGASEGLRDRFAAGALASLIQVYQDPPEPNTIPCLCESAYQYADGMLEAREVQR